MWLLNARGTYESDLTVTRTGPEEFLLVSSAATTVRDQDWIVKHIGDRQHVSVTDISSAYAVFGVMGPKSRELLSRLTDSDLDDVDDVDDDDDAFGFGTSQEIDLGHATVRATRITYVGELGWELYVPAEFAVGGYEDLMRCGADLGVARAGYYAIESMRLEKGYRAFGRELTPDYNPVEAGLLFACKLKTDIDFLGRAAVEKVRSDGVVRRLVSFLLGDGAPMLWGGELVLRDGVAVGQVTSAAWGEAVGACVELAYVADPGHGVVTRDWAVAGSYQVSIGGDLYDIVVTLKPPFDPAGAKIRP